ncbi:MAG: oligopeptidase B, partial [Candidatus Latescibacterota bacterium]
MRYLGLIIVLFVLIGVFGGSAAVESEISGLLQPPIAKIVPMTLEKHEHVRVDNYYWLKDRDNPEVISYLEAENEYADAMMAHSKELEDALFDEIKGRIKQTDMSVPYKFDDYYYYTRYEEGQEYPIYCRKKESLQGPEEIMLDVNELAEGHEFYMVRGTNVSFAQDILAYAVDTVGRRKYSIRFKNLKNGEMLPDV